MQRLMSIKDASWKNDGSLDELKKHFVQCWLRSDDPWKAAREVFPGIDQGNDVALAFSQWPHDPFVIEYKRELLAENGKEAFLPDRVDVARRAWEAMETHKGSELLAFMRFYCQVAGIELADDTRNGTPGTSAVVNIGNMMVNNGVLPVRSFDTPEQRAAFENGSAERQGRLVADARKLAGSVVTDP